MNPEEANLISERDQLWASLRALVPEIDRLAEGDFDSSARQQQIISLLARIVVAEIGFRVSDTSAE